MKHENQGAQNQGHFGGYGRFGAGASQQGQSIAQWQEQKDAENAASVERAEQVDLNADLHGGWTVENGKKKLNEWCQQNKQRQPECHYTPTGPDNQRSFYAEMRIFVPQLKRQIFAREHGSNKKVSSSAAALSLVRQLYHLNVIEAFTGQTTVKKSETEFEPIKGRLDPEISAELDRAVSAMGLQRQDLTQDGSLIVKSATGFEPQEKVPQGCIPWCPPVSNWNPWTGSNIEDGFYFNQNDEFINNDICSQNIKIDPEIIRKRNELPIYKERGRLLDMIRNNSVLIVKGETGSGKTTQLAQYILEEAIENGQPSQCSIIVTQPRKISAISIAERMARERGGDDQLGQSVGYRHVSRFLRSCSFSKNLSKVSKTAKSVRFESCLPRSHGSIMLCTVGVLLRKLESGLRGVSHVVVDEIHERDLNTDFLLVVLRDIVFEFPQVRIILMSATIDTRQFSEYFNNAPVVEVSGRTFPVNQYFLEDIVQMLGYQVIRFTNYTCIFTLFSDTPETFRKATT